jgi:hypothetical protein
LKEYCTDNIQKDYFQNLFPLYLFVVDLILAIIPQDRWHLKNKESLAYAQDLANASKIFKDLANRKRKPDELVSHEWERIKRALNSQSFSEENCTSKMTLLWVFLDTWAKTYHKNVWSVFKNQNEINLSNSLKITILRLFAYSQEKLTHDYEKIT